jgi:hypothetical protein
MRKILILLLFFTTLINQIVAQKTKETINGGKPIFTTKRVKIDNFNQKAADCGVEIFVSIYKAKILDYKSLDYGKTIFIYVPCREAFGNFVSFEPIYDVQLKNVSVNLKNTTIVNYSGTNLDSISNERKYVLLSIKK